MAKVCDCFPQLKEITDARERRYRADPEKPAPEGPQSVVEVKVTSIGGLNELVECKRSGFKFVISEPSHVGGQNCAPSPLEFLLSGAVGCYAAVFAFYAAKLGIAYDGFEAVARTEFDARGHMIAEAPTSAFRKVTIGLRRLPRHQHVARAGAGGDAARGDARQSGAGGVGGAASAMAGKPSGKASPKTSRKPYRVGRSPTGLGLRDRADRERRIHRRIQG